MKTNREIIDQFLPEMKSIVDHIGRNKIDQIIEALYETWDKGDRMHLMGNDGSAPTAFHLVNDFGKCTALPGEKRFKVNGLTDHSALITALVNDNGFDNLYSEQLLNFMEPDDTLVGSQSLYDCQRTRRKNHLVFNRLIEKIAASEWVAAQSLSCAG